MFTIVFVSKGLRQTKAILVETGRTLLTAQQTASRGADEAPVGVDVTVGRALLTLGWGEVFGTDDVRLGDLDGARSHTVIPRVVGCGTPGAVHQLPAVLHHGVLGVVTGAGVAGVGGTVEGVVGYLGLRPDAVASEAVSVEALATARD